MAAVCGLSMSERPSTRAEGAKCQTLGKFWRVRQCVARGAVLRHMQRADGERLTATRVYVWPHSQRRCAARRVTCICLV